MKYLNQWAKGRPLGLVIAAQQLAVSAEGCFEFLRLVKSGEKIEALPSVRKNKECLSFYRNHRQMLRGIFDHLRKYGRNGELVAEVGEGLFFERREEKDALFRLRLAFWSVK